MSILTSNPLSFTVLPSPSFVKKFDPRLGSNLFAGSQLDHGDLDGAALEAEFFNLKSIVAMTDGSQRKMVNESWNRFFVMDYNKIKLIHPCEEIIEPI